MTVGRTDELTAELNDILVATRETTNLAPLPAQKLDETIAAVDAVKERLLDLQMHVVLVEGSQDDDDMDGARRLWELVDADQSIAVSDALISASPTLSTLHRAALTIRSFHRFGDERLRLAGLFGEVASTHPQYIGLLASRNSESHKTFQIAADVVPGMTRVLSALSDAGATSGFQLQGYFEPKNGKPFWKDRNSFPISWKPSKWRIWRGEVKSEWTRFLAGDWLTAYAYCIAYDQFMRAGAPFEIYSKVEYQLPSDLGGGRSDIDVLVRTADQVLCIECKSGRVLTSHNGSPSAALKTLRGAERLDQLLDTMEVGLDRTYQLLYLCPPGEDPAEVRGAVDVGRVPLLVSTPADERRLVQRLALRQGLDQIERPSDLEGTWLIAASDGNVARLRLESGGRFEWHREFDEAGSTRHGTWELAGDVLILSSRGSIAQLKREDDGALVGTLADAWGNESRVTVVRIA